MRAERAPRKPCVYRKPKLAHSDDEVRQGLHATQCVRSNGQDARLADPCPTIDVFSLRCNSERRSYSRYRETCTSHEQEAALLTRGLFLYVGKTSEAAQLNGPYLPFPAFFFCFLGFRSFAQSGGSYNPFTSTMTALQNFSPNSVSPTTLRSPSTSVLSPPSK